MRFLLLTILLAPLYSITSCSSGPSCLSITPPRVNVTTEQTAIERQIIGDYRELEKDAWAISSARTLARGTGSGSKLMGADRELFIAMKIREFHRDQIRTYKKQRAVGEAINGYLVYRHNRKYEKNAVEKEILLKVVTNENAARKKIFSRSLFLLNDEEPTASQVAAFGILFAAEQRKAARKNTWIQDNNGKWVRK